jgi:hypothetical protein
MPFDMGATTHIFTKTPEGGVQRVVVRSPEDTKQTALIRRHLKDMADRFARGDFGAPTDVHGAERCRGSPPSRRPPPENST